MTDWRPFPDFEDYYEISNTGIVRSLDRETPNTLTGGTSLVKGRELVGRINRGGYRQVTLSVKQKNTTRTIHRAVAKAFIPNPDSKPLVLHGPNGKLDNSVGNLRWGTNSDNMYDKRRDGTDHMLNKTHCPKDHPYDEKNTVYRGSNRSCRICNKEKSKRAYWRAREKKLALGYKPNPIFPCPECGKFSKGSWERDGSRGGTCKSHGSWTTTDDSAR